MKFAYFLVLLLVVAVSTSAQKESEDEDSAVEEKEKKSKSKSKSETKSTGKASEKLQQAEFLVTPDEKLVVNSKNPEKFYSGPPSGSEIPFLGFSDPRTGSQGHNFFLSDGTGRYNVQLQSFQQPNSPHFNTAVGALSAHILNNQRSNQEYVPYPPNGDPYNYPAYRGYPHATEPPVVRAYETANNVNYNGQPSANFDQYNQRTLLSNNIYPQPFPNHFENFGLYNYNNGFYNNPYLFNGPGFYSGFRRNDDSDYDDRFQEQRRSFNRPIK